MELIDRVRRIVHPKLVCFSILAAFAAASALAQPSTLMVAPTMLTFTAASGGAPAPTQTIAANATTTPLPVALVVRYLSPVDGWLSIAPDSGTTSLTVTVSADPKGLAPATYQAQIVATSGTTQSVIVTVNFTVTPAGSGGGRVLTASPSTITLTASTGTLVTSAVNVGSSAPTPFNFFVSTASGGSWLTTSPLL